MVSAQKQTFWEVLSKIPLPFVVMRKIRKEVKNTNHSPSNIFVRTTENSQTCTNHAWSADIGGGGVGDALLEEAAH